MSAPSDGESASRHHLRIPLLGRLAPPFGSDFVEFQPLGAVVLLLAVALALVWSNLSFGHTYREFWGHELTIGIGDVAITNALNRWINEGLMAVFFFVVAVEMKREVVVGELRGRRRAAVPLVAALGGMAVPALIFTAFNLGSATAKGWAVPMATDTAFAVGLLALFGSRVPRNTKVLLTSLAVVDDLGAIVAIAIFYGHSIDAVWIPVALATVGLAVLLRALHVSHPLAYVPVALLLWVAIFEAGFHATVAGVVLGLLVPAATPPQRAALHRLEDRLRPWALLVVIPIFAFANAGVSLSLHSFTGLGSTVGLGIVVGLVVGKFAGICAGTWAVTRSGLGDLPDGVTRYDIALIGTIAGVGFTVSLFVAELAFTGPTLAHAKVAILTASAISAVVGCGLAARQRARPRGPRLSDP